MFLLFCSPIPLLKKLTLSPILSLFRTLRKLFKVDPADYMLSICGNDALRELSSPGKSGSFFYLTNDDRYMIKTMKKSEAKVSHEVFCMHISVRKSTLAISHGQITFWFMVQVLIRMLPAYYNHVRSYENTLVTKFYGLHCVKLNGTAQKKVYLPPMLGRITYSARNSHETTRTTLVCVLVWQNI